MKLKMIENTGFGGGWRFSRGWLQVDWTKFEDHWYLQIMWSKPIKVVDS